MAVELPTLTFQRKDFSQAKSDLGCALRRTARCGSGHYRPRSRWASAVVAVRKFFLFPNSLDAKDNLICAIPDSHIVLSKDVPQLIGQRIKGLVEGFSGAAGLDARKTFPQIFAPSWRAETAVLSWKPNQLLLPTTDRFPGTFCAASAIFQARVSFLFFKRLAARPRDAIGQLRFADGLRARFHRRNASAAMAMTIAISRPVGAGGGRTPRGAADFPPQSAPASKSGRSQSCRAAFPLDGGSSRRHSDRRRCRSSVPAPCSDSCSGASDGCIVGARHCSAMVGDSIAGGTLNAGSYGVITGGSRYAWPIPLGAPPQLRRCGCRIVCPPNDPYRLDHGNCRNGGESRDFAAKGGRGRWRPDVQS